MAESQVCIGCGSIGAMMCWWESQHVCIDCNSKEHHSSLIFSNKPRTCHVCKVEQKEIAFAIHYNGSVCSSCIKLVIGIVSKERKAKADASSTKLCYWCRQICPIGFFPSFELDGVKRSADVCEDCKKSANEACWERRNDKPSMCEICKEPQEPIHIVYDANGSTKVLYACWGCKYNFYKTPEPKSSESTTPTPKSSESTASEPKTLQLPVE